MSPSTSFMPRGDPYKAQAREIVLDVLEDVLALDRSAIGPRNTLQGGLGMESIDTLDIMFNLECKTGVRGLDPFGQQIPLKTDPRTQIYTQESMAKIRDQMSHFYNAMSPTDREAFDQQRSSMQFQRAWNVDGLVAYVETQLRAKNTKN